MKSLDAKGRAKISEALQQWRQGDCVLGEQWFVFRVSPDAPLTDDAAAAAEDGVENAEGAVFGFAVVTQTCDIVRDCGERPFVEVCPLVEVDEDKLHEIERGRRPNYAYLPGLASRHLVADLDRVMTVEKPVVAQWERVAGCLDDNDSRRLSLALSRKRARFAFPNDFVTFAAPLKSRMSDKHDKGSDEGRALRALREDPGSGRAVLECGHRPAHVLVHPERGSADLREAALGHAPQGLVGASSRHGALRRGGRRGAHPR